MSQSPPPAHESSAPGSHYQPALSVVLIIVVLFIAATFVMLRSTGAASPNAAARPLPPTPVTSGPPNIVRAKSHVRVQVANGTLTAGLARTFTQQLLTLGWDTLPQLNAARVSSTIVYYNPGFLWAAQQIAGDIKVSSSAIHPLGLLRPVSGAAGDDVIVILGPDVAVQG